VKTNVNEDLSFFAGFIVGLIFCALVFSLYNVFRDADRRYLGHVEVASGQVVCELKTKPDKTTNWLCVPKPKETK
jgi:hypothetical protein